MTSRATPAVDVGKSVSRVGGKAQLPAYRAVAGALRLAYAQFEELETFARFGTRLDPATRATIERGRRVREVLKQTQFAPLSVPEQIATLVAVNGGLFDRLPLAKIAEAEAIVRQAATAGLPQLCEQLLAGQKLTDVGQRAILDSAQAALDAAYPSEEATEEKAGST